MPVLKEFHCLWAWHEENRLVDIRFSNERGILLAIEAVAMGSGQFHCMHTLHTILAIKVLKTRTVTIGGEVYMKVQ